MLNLQIFSKTVFNRKTIKNANKVKMNCRKLVILLMHIQVGLCGGTMLINGLFVCFVALRPKSAAMVIAGRSVHLTTLFPGQA